jgi:flagellar protein FlgJ
MAIVPNNINNLASDAQSLDKLRYQAKQAPDKALKVAAQQFEMVFLNMMLKTMREATPQDGMMDSEQTKMFTGMLDQQLAQEMSARGVGLADVMVRQLSRSIPGAAPAVAAVNINSVPSAYSADTQQSFVDRLRPHAEAASRTTGIPAHLIVGQAALESGWGKREIKMADGSTSFNLFGIKAGKGWHGKVAEITTTEYTNGVSHKQIERFRAYGSYTEAFQDYAKLLSDNPRYAAVIGQDGAQGFAQALQQAGYATDPDYADKLVKVIGSVSARA